VILNQKTAVCSVALTQKKLIRAPDYLKLFLTPAEIRYCRSKKYPAEPAAARIAAKKAIFSLLRLPPSKQSLWMREIQIAKQAAGKPFIKFSARFKRKFKLASGNQWMLTLAHERELAVAWVLVCAA
jgi:holo-[acyl-carrier-protein] synthase